MYKRSVWQSGLVWVAVATFAMAFKGIWARLIYQEHVAVNALLIWRFALALPMYWLGAAWLNRGRQAVRLTRNQWGWCAFTGLLFFLSAWCDFHAIQALGASISRLVLYVFPALLMIAQAVEQRCWPARLQLLCFCAAWGGIALLLLPGWAGGDLNLAGLAFGLGAAICYAGFWRTSQLLMKPLGSVRFNQWSNAFTLVFMVLFLLPTLKPSQLLLSPAACGWMLVLVVFSTVVPFFILFEGLNRTNAAEAGVVSMFGPVVTVLVAQLVFPDERLGALQWAGMAVVLASIGLLTRVKVPPTVPRDPVTRNEAALPDRRSGPDGGRARL